MLPDGFEWRGWLGGGYALFLDQCSVAIVTPEEGFVRVSINHGLVSRRFESFSQVAVGKRYVEAWARKWETELRAAYRTRM